MTLAYKTSLLILFSATALSFSAMAQTGAATPPEDALKTAAATERTVSTAGTPDDSCPLPENADSANPDDLAKVQEDIDRYTLCVQRAELLQQLNETEAESRKNLEEALDLKSPTLSDVMGGSAQMGGNMPPPPSGFEAGQVASLNADSLDMGAGSGGFGALPVQSTEWQINSVSGQGRSLKAMLIAPDGSLQRVQAGSVLPNEGGTVASITASDVRVTKDKKTKSLNWAERDPTAKTETVQ